MKYSIGRVMSEAVMGLDHPEYGRQIWTRVIMRKQWKCQITGQSIGPGEQAWLPMTNGMNRMHRISEAGMARLAKQALEETP